MIDRYEILRKLATGGMAELFLAKQSGLEGFEKVVVIKRILSHLAQDEEFVTMFLDEARIAAKLSHPNIVQIYDLGKAEDSYYIAMEYVSGRNVQHILNKQEQKGALMPIEHACRILAGVCDGLHYAHSRKDYDGQPLDIVHRDISPQNILVSFAGGVKVVDFGIAKASTQLAQTRAGVLKGKYAYMSPEQVRGQTIDHRSDIFAVGLVMYEALTGRRAFERDSSLKTLKAIVQDKPLNPRELNPDIPLEVIKLLSRALEKSPDRRYKNAQEMQLAIEDYLESSPRKSNNVRLSRYLYELFDDELNSESGTMVVQGIGEVIIPTGANRQEEKKKVSVEEDVDSKTLSAALLPKRPEPGDDEPALGRRKPSEPGVRVVHDDQASGQMPSAPPTSVEQESTNPQEEAESTNVNAEAPVPPPGADDVDEYASSEEEPEDKTIPVYDIENYEAERQRRHQSQEAGNGVEDATAASLFPASLPAEHVLGPDDATAAAIEPPVASSRRGSASDQDRRAAQMLAKVEAMAEGVSEGATIPPPNAGTEDDGPDWEDPTQAAPPTAPLMDGQLHSTEAVIGSGGPVAVAGEDGGIRPAAATSGDIRPAARAGARPVASASIKEITRPPVEPPEHTIPSQPIAALADATAPLDSPTPTTGRSPAAQIQMQGRPQQPPPQLQAAPPTGVPGLVIGLIALMVVFFLTAVGAVIALVVLDGSSNDGAKGASRLLSVETIPDGLTLLRDGSSQTAPASFIVKQGEVVTIEVEYKGQLYQSKIDIDLGSAPLKRTINMAKEVDGKPPPPDE